jgi:hypothetical protein
MDASPDTAGHRTLRKRLIAVSLLLLPALAAAVWVYRGQANSAQFALSDDDYRRLWDVEHVVFELNHNVFEHLKQALAEDDKHLARRTLAAGFEGHWPNGDQQTFLDNDQVRITVQNSNPNLSVHLDAQGIVDRLFDLQAEFERVDNIRLHMHHLEPVGGSDGGVRRWQGDADLRLTGKWRAASQSDGRREASNAEAELVALFDIEVDADPDWQELPFGCIKRLTINRIERRGASRPLFEEVAGAAGLPIGKLHDNWQPGAELATQTGGIYLADIDNDRWLDCLVTDRHRIWLLLGSSSGKFRDVSHLSQLPTTFATTPYAAFVDLDNDGALDLLLGSLRYCGRGDGTFEPDGRLHFEGHRGFALADYDRDGDVDLFVIRDHEPFERQSSAGEPVSWLDDRRSGARSMLLRNDEGELIDVSQGSGISADRRISMAAAWFDANDDGWPDLYVANDMGPNQLYINRHDGSFAESSAAYRLQDAASSMGVVAGDLDEDGRADLYVSNMYSTAGTRIIKNAAGMHTPEVHEQLRRMAGGNSLYRQTAPGRFEEVPEAAGTAHSGWAYGTNLVDIDNDGLLDLYVPAGYLSVDASKPDG